MTSVSSSLISEAFKVIMGKASPTAAKYMLSVFSSEGTINSIVECSSRNFASANKILNTVESGQRVELHWTKELTIMPLGKGITNTTNKKKVVVSYSSRPTNTSDQSWLNNLRNVAMEKMKANKKSPQADLHGNLFFVREGEGVRQAEEADLLREAELYYAPAQVSYSTISMAVVARTVRFPWEPREMIPPQDYFSRMTEQFHHQADLFAAVDAFISGHSTDVRWLNYTTIFFNALYACQSAHEPSDRFNEATRRTIVDPVINAAALYAGRYVGVEKTQWAPGSEDNPNPRNILGHGPLDWLSPGINVVSAFESPEFPPGFPAPEDTAAPPKRPPVLVHTVPDIAVTPSESTQKSEMDEEPGAEESSEGEGAETEESEGETGERSQTKRGPVKTGFVEVDRVTGAAFLENTAEPVVPTVNTSTGEGPALVKEGKATTPSESRNRQILNSALAQLIAQSRDSMHSHKRKVVDEEYEAIRDKDFTYMVVTTGQRYFYFGLDWRSNENNPIVVYYGCLRMPYFPYTLTRHSGSTRATPTSGYRRVSRQDFDRLVAATILVMRDELKGIVPTSSSSASAAGVTLSSSASAAGAAATSSSASAAGAAATSSSSGSAPHG